MINYKKNTIKVEGKGTIYIFTFDDEVSVFQQSDFLKEYREKYLLPSQDESNTVFICASDKCPATITFTGSKVQYKLVGSDNKPLTDEAFKNMLYQFNINTDPTLFEWFELIR